MKSAAIKQGWLRALIYFLLFIALALTLQQPVTNAASMITKDPQQHFMVSYSLMATVFILFTWLSKLFLDRESFMELGFRWNGYQADAGLGFFTAVSLMGMGTLILLTTKKITITGTAFDPAALSLQLLLMVVVALSEEIVFRGYLLYNLMASLNKWVALSISAILFALVHGANPGISAVPLANIVLAGFLLGINFMYTRNIWFGVMLHLAWNYLQGPVLGYQVSGIETQSVLTQYVTGSDLWTGGKFGFEGSLICTILLAAAILIWTYLFAQKYPTATTI